MSLKTLENHNIELIGHSDLNGNGDCMQLQFIGGNHLAVAHMGKTRAGTSIVDISDPTSPTVVALLENPPGTHSHKVQVVDNYMIVNQERNPNEKAAKEWTAGISVYDVSTPESPEKVGFVHAPGLGVHRMTWFDFPYAYVGGSDVGFSDQIFLTIDLSDPTSPFIAGRWWWPGMNKAAGEEQTWIPPQRFKCHHPMLRNGRAYAGWWDAGYVILDIEDPTMPKLVYKGFFEDAGGYNHTLLPLPGRDIAISTEEAVRKYGQEHPKHIRVIDISNETAPQVLSKFPVPKGDYTERGGVFGPHNIHEMKPGTFNHSSLIHATYWNGGIRLYDVTDPYEVVEVGACVPEAPTGQDVIQMNDLIVRKDGIIFTSDRISGGLYVMQGPDENASLEDLRK